MFFVLFFYVFLFCCSLWAKMRLKDHKDPWNLDCLATNVVNPWAASVWLRFLCQRACHPTLWQWQRPPWSGAQDRQIFCSAARFLDILQVQWLPEIYTVTFANLQDVAVLICSNMFESTFLGGQAFSICQEWVLWQCWARSLSGSLTRFEIRSQAGLARRPKTWSVLVSIPWSWDVRGCLASSF